MSQEERARWDQKYAAGSHARLEPDPLLPYAYREFIEPLFPQGGRALDIAGGVGRHAIWMAAKDWNVTLADISEVGVKRAQINAAGLGVRIDFQVSDVTTAAWEPSSYDLILVFFYLERGIFPQMQDALRPGGLIVYKTYTHLAPGFGKGPSHPMHLLGQNELLHAFPGTTVLHYEETLRDRGTAELVVKKP